MMNEQFQDQEVPTGDQLATTAVDIGLVVVDDGSRHVSSRITKLALKNRFPREKWKALKALIGTSADLDGNIEDFFESYNLAAHINLELPETIDSINALTLPIWPESARLTPDEAHAILSTPGADGEIYRD